MLKVKNIFNQHQWWYLESLIWNLTANEDTMNNKFASTELETIALQVGSFKKKKKEKEKG